MYIDRQSTPIILERSQFQIAAEGVSPHNVTSRAWHESCWLADFRVNTGPFRRDDKNWERLTLNFTDLMARIREIETGTEPLRSIGRTAWNLVARVNNQDLVASHPDILIDWADHIHPQFRNSEARRQRAAEELASAYQQLRESF